MPTNKIIYGNQTLMDLTSDTVTPNDVMSGVTFHDRSGTLQTGSLSLDEYATIDLLEDTVGWVGKNLLPQGTSSTHNSVTFTVNANGSITANGTATGGNAFWAKSVPLKAGSYAVNGCPSNGGLDNYRIDVRDNIGGTTVYTDDSGSGGMFTLNSDTTVYVNIRIASGYAASNLVFYPMLRDASIIDDTYEPYHESVEQTLRDAEVIEGKNIYPYSDTKNNIVIGHVKAGNHYTFSFTNVGNCGFNLKKNNSSGSIIVAHDASATTGRIIETFQPDEECDVFLNGFGGATGYTFLNSAQDIQLEEGSSATSYEPYYIPLKDSKFDRSEQRVLGAKNLLVPLKVSRTEAGGVWTVNSDGTISVSGIPTAWSGVTFQASKVQNKKYIISGTDKATNVRWGAAELKDASGTSLYTIAEIPNDGYELDFTPYSTAYSVNIQLKRKDNNVAMSGTVYPMLRLASDPDDTYVPYAMTNRELTEKIENTPTIVPTPSASLTENTVVSTVNSAILNGGTDRGVPSNFDMGKWSNTMSKAFLVQGVVGSGTPVGTSGVGTWPANVNSPTSAEKADWMCIPELYGCGSVLGIKFDLVYDPATVSVPIARGGYVIDDNETMSDGQGGTINCAKVCLKFANEISEADTHTAVVGVEITIKRTETVFVG